MKVIHLPVNISSQISSTVRALNTLGVEARGLARNHSNIQAHAGIETVDWLGSPNPAARLWRGVRWRWKLVSALTWADVVHWHWGDTTWKQMDLRLAAKLGKKRLVEFWGDDLRDPTIASRDNRFLARVYGENPELAGQHSKATQKMFQRHGFACLIPGYELRDYVDASIFAGFYQTRPRLFLQDYTPIFPDPERRNPIVAHAPSDKAKKGTEAVLKAVAQLQRDHRFEFKLIHKMPRDQALAAVAEADLFLDQFTIGAEGLAALEAMALGKPVMCFIKESLRSRYPDGFPIVTTNQDNLAEALTIILNDGPGRHELGIRGRRYVETYHDAQAVAADLVEVYRDLPGGASGSSNQSWNSSCRHWVSAKPENRGTVACAR
jgi:glycosyltransferase involved in cell wall biosynthesis